MTYHSGRGGRRSDEPPELATVQPLHGGELDHSSATATDDWYETERLTGHITGGARPFAPTGRPATPDAGQRVVLDWRHAEPPPVPTILARLRGTLEGRLHRRHTRRQTPPWQVNALARARACATRGAMFVASREASRGSASQHGEGAAEAGAAPPGPPRIGLRGDGDPSPRPTRPRSVVRVRSRGRHAALRPGLLVGAVIVSGLAVAVVGVAPRWGATSAPPRHAHTAAAASSLPGAASGVAATSGVLDELRRVERTSRTSGSVSQGAHHAVKDQRGSRHKTRRSGGARKRQRTVRRSAGRAASSSSQGSAGLSASSSSAPAYSSRPATTESAPASTKTAPRPAGPSGLGGVVGRNCNPKCS
jgi:hypothetical protein